MAGKKGRSGGHNRKRLEHHLAAGTYRADRHGPRPPDPPRFDADDPHERFRAVMAEYVPDEYHRGCMDFALATGDLLPPELDPDDLPLLRLLRDEFGEFLMRDMGDGAWVLGRIRELEGNA